MKRLVLILISAALLCACTTTPAAPVVEPDARAQETPTAAVEETVAAKPTEAPATEAPATEAPTEAPTEVPATEAPIPQGFAQRVAAAWEQAGLLSDCFAYSDADVLDMYDIDLSACKSGAVYVDATGYTRELLVIETEEAMAADIYAMLTEHLQSVKATFRSYDPEAYAVAERAILLKDGGVVLYLVAPEAEAMKSVFDAVER